MPDWERMNNRDQNIKTVPAPRLRFSGFTGAWEEKKLGEFLTESRLAGSDGAKARKITVKLWGKGVYEKQDKIQGSENTKYFKRNAGQLIYSKLDFLNGAFGIIPQELDGLESTLDLPCFDLSSDLIPKYILEYISRKEFYSKFEGGALGGRKARRVTPEEFLSTPFPLPSLSEQHHIAAALSSLDEVIAAHQAKQDALREHRKGLMGVLFPVESDRVPRLRFPEFEGAEGWEEKTLGELLLNRPDYGLNAPAVPFSEELPTYLRITDISEEGKYIHSGRVSVNTQVTEENYLQDGDIVLARTGASVGKSYLHNPSDGRLVFAGFLIRLKPNPEIIDPYYLSSFLNTPQYWMWVAVNSARSGQPGINSSEYSSLLIPCPALAEQRRIAACLLSLDDLIFSQGDKISALQDFKRGLVNNLFLTGDINETPN